MKQFISLLLNNTSFLTTWNGEMAFKILCRVKRVQITSQGKLFLNSANHTYKKNIDGFEATVYRFGNGPHNLIFLHGWMSNSQRWEKYIDELDSTKYSCYLIDAPGHGNSLGKSLNLEIYRKFVVDLISELKSIHTIVGHSLGSLVTSYAYLVNKELPVHNLVITGSPEGMNAIYAFFKRVLGLKTSVIVNLNNHITSQVTHIPAHDILMKPFFEQITIPTLVIHDITDRVCPITPIKEGTEGRKQIEFYATENLGHDLAASEVYKKVASFITNKKATNKN